MTLEWWFVDVVFTVSVAVAGYGGYLIGKARGWHQNADHIEALETLLADLRKPHETLAEYKASLHTQAEQPHVHTFTYGAQRRDHDWDIRECQICGMENARKAGGH